MALPLHAYVEQVDRARAAGAAASTSDLVALLAERHPLYAGLDANSAVRLRGYVLAAFARTGLPEAALPFVIEALETGQHPYLVGAAARALRGAPRPEAWMAPLLDRAVERMRSNDDTFSLDEFGAQWPIDFPTTAAGELEKAVAWIGAPPPPAPRACCAVPASILAHVHVMRSARQGRSVLADAVLEDQDGISFSAAELFTGKPAVVAFFYTRCANPMKCSRTVTALGELQSLLHEQQLGERVRVLAITYDSSYDTPQRLRNYAAARGFTFGADSRALRAAHGSDAILAAFDVHASFSDVTVSQHATELFIVDGAGQVTASFQRLQWQPAEVMREVRQALGL